MPATSRLQPAAYRSSFSFNFSFSLSVGRTIRLRIARRRGPALPGFIGLGRLCWRFVVGARDRLVWGPLGTVRAREFSMETSGRRRWNLGTGAAAGWSDSAGAAPRIGVRGRSSGIPFSQRIDEMRSKQTTECRLVTVHRLTDLPDLSFLPDLPDFRDCRRPNVAEGRTCLHDKGVKSCGAERFSRSAFVLVFASKRAGTKPFEPQRHRAHRGRKAAIRLGSWISSFDLCALRCLCGSSDDFRDCLLAEPDPADLVSAVRVILR